LKGSHLLDALRRALQTGEVSAIEVEDMLAEERGSEYREEIRRGLLAGECVMDVQRTREFGEPIRLHLIRCFDDLVPNAPSVANDDPPAPQGEPAQEAS
jgi:hypothetical protein